jgi:phosphatidylserine/phosphatidylglycerophosphate/cardiolipin synthase-like enzyme
MPIVTRSNSFSLNPATRALCGKQLTTCTRYRPLCSKPATRFSTLLARRSAISSFLLRLSILREQISCWNCFQLVGRMFAATWFAVLLASGDAFRRRAGDFRRLGVAVYEYALASSLPSGRETFHAKVVLADDSMFYVGSSNFMGSALERSFECRVIVQGAAAKELQSVLEAMRSIAMQVRDY